MFDGSWADEYVLDPGNEEWRQSEVRFRVRDRLYVREAWRAQEAFDHLSPVEIGNEFAQEYGNPWCPVFFEADQKCDGSSIEMWQQSPLGRRRQGMHMPRWASRLTLMVTDVRVQRLQDITAEDCRAEGHPVEWDRSPDPEVHDDAAHDWFRDLWDSLNADRGYGWAANPWVVCLTFETHRKNIDEMEAAHAA